MKAKSDAERAKEYRERKKLKAAGLLPEQPQPAKLEIPKYLTLSEYVRREGEEAVEAFEWMKDFGIPVDHFLTDQHKEQEIEWTYNIIRDLDIALSTLTSFLSSYWIDQINHEIDRLKKEGLSDAATKDEALAKIVRFTEMRKNLEKRYRLTLQNYEPEG